MNFKRLINKAVKKRLPSKLDWIYQNYYVPYYHLMYLLAGTIEHGLLVELGVHHGRGLASLAAPNRSNRVIGLDTERWIGLDDVIKEFPNIWFLKVASLPVPIVIMEAARKINLLHIDTEHSHSMAKAEFEAYQPYLAKGAYVLFDDLHAADDGVKEYFDTLPYEKYEDDRLHPSCGYGIVIYE